MFRNFCSSAGKILCDFWGRYRVQKRVLKEQRESTDVGKSTEGDFTSAYTVLPITHAVNYIYGCLISP